MSFVWYDFGQLIRTHIALLSGDSIASDLAGDLAQKPFALIDVKRLNESCKTG